MKIFKIFFAAIFILALAFGTVAQASAQTANCLTLAGANAQIACLTNLIAKLTIQVNQILGQQATNNSAQVSSQTMPGCGGTPLCTAGAGYDGPTGWGTPKGLGAF